MVVVWSAGVVLLGITASLLEKFIRGVKLPPWSAADT
jgi:hypothetical protein